MKERLNKQLFLLRHGSVSWKAANRGVLQTVFH